MTGKFFKRHTLVSIEPIKGLKIHSTTGMHGPAALPAIATLLRSLSTCPEITHPPIASNRIGAGNSIEAVKIGEASEPGTATVVFYLPMRCCTFCRMLYVVLDSLWNRALLALYC